MMRCPPAPNRSALNDPANYEWNSGSSEDRTFSFTISKTASIVKTAPVAIEGLVYNGTARTLITAGENDHGTFRYQLDDGEWSKDLPTAIDAGTYTVNWKLVGDTNHADQICEDSIAIERQTVEKPVEQNTQYTYTGDAQTFYLTENAYYTVSNHIQTNAGTYAVTVTPKSNYKWTDGSTDALNFTFTINKRQIAKPAADGRSFVFNNQDQTYTLGNTTDSGWYEITGNQQKDAGSYTVKAALRDKANCVWHYADGKTPTAEDLTFDFVISKLQVAKPTADDTVFTYNGEKKTYTFGNDGDKVWYAIFGSTEAVDAGTYPLTVSLKDKDNCVWTDETEQTTTDLLFGFTIHPKAITVTAADQTITYGEPITASDGGSGVKEIRYFVADKELTETEIAALSWTDYNGSFTLDADMSKEIPWKDGFDDKAPIWSLDGTTKADGKNIQADTTFTAVYYKNEPGIFADTTDPGANAAGVNVSASIGDLQKAVPLTEEELTRVEMGDDVKIWMVSTDASAAVPAEDKALAEGAMSGDVIGMYLDITLWKQIGNQSPVQVHQLNSSITITLEIPVSLINSNFNYTRTYYVIRVHNGVATVITPTFHPLTRTLTFETDQFSTYAISYVDTAKPVSIIPNTGDNSHIGLWNGIFGLSSTALVVLLVMNRKKSGK